MGIDIMRMDLKVGIIRRVLVQVEIAGVETACRKTTVILVRHEDY